MTFQLSRTAYVDTTGGNSFSLSGLFTPAAAGNPAYLVVNALDRNEYTAAATGATGSFSGNGKTLALASIGSDGRGAGIVYTWNAATKSYINATYGTLNQLSYTSSASAYDVTNISFFGESSLLAAQVYASNAYALAQTDASGYLGSVTFSTNKAGATAGTNATPNAIVASANSMVGKAWNENGCWVLASTIAAASGAGLPVQSSMLGIPGQANGPWYVAYDGPVSSNANWQSLVAAGDMITFITGSGGGHITTCVAGSGSTAQLIDNITYVNGSGQILNPANDGSSSDILIQAAHPASQEWSGVAAGSVVIYALDTPVVHDLVASKTAGASTKITLSSLFSAADPEGNAITKYQVYLTRSADSLLLGGAAAQNSSTAPLTATSLGSLVFLAGATAGADQIELRAFNGTYWGDWQSLTVTDTGGTTGVHGMTLKAAHPPQDASAGGHGFVPALETAAILGHAGVSASALMFPHLF